MEGERVRKKIGERKGGTEGKGVQVFGAKGELRRRGKE
jgi:hypothetical protein